MIQEIPAEWGPDATHIRVWILCESSDPGTDKVRVWFQAQGIDSAIEIDTSARTANPSTDWTTGALPVPYAGDPIGRGSINVQIETGVGAGKETTLFGACAWEEVQ